MTVSNASRDLQIGDKVWSRMESPPGSSLRDPNLGVLFVTFEKGENVTSSWPIKRSLGRSWLIFTLFHRGLAKGSCGFPVAEIHNYQVIQTVTLFSPSWRSLNL